MQHASAEARTDNITPAVSPAQQLDRRPWPVRIRTAAADTDLPAVTRCFAVTLSTFFDRNGRWAMSPEQISEATGHSRAQVFEHVKRCKAAGLINVVSGRGVRRTTYSAGPAIISTPPAESKVAESGMPDTGVRNTGPISIRNTGSESGCQDRTAQHNSTDREGSNKPRRDPRDDDRITCPKCSASWPRRFGSLCMTCSALSPDVPGNRPVVTKRGKDTDIRHACTSCDRSWPQKFGPRCKGCSIDVTAPGMVSDAEWLAEGRREQERERPRRVLCQRCSSAYDASVPGAGAQARCPTCRDLSDSQAAKLASEWTPARLPLAGDAKADAEAICDQQSI